MVYSTFGRFFHSLAGSLESSSSFILPACNLFAGSLESVNSSILLAGSLFKDFGGEKVRTLTLLTRKMQSIMVNMEWADNC